MCGVPPRVSGPVLPLLPAPPSGRCRLDSPRPPDTAPPARGFLAASPHTDGVKRPVAVLRPKPRKASLDHAHRIPSCGDVDVPAGHLPSSDLCRSAELQASAGFSLQVTPQTPRRSATRCPPARLITCALGCAVSNSPTTPPRPSVRHRAHRGWQWGKSGSSGSHRGAGHTHFPPPAPSADILGLACLFFFFLQTSPKLHFPFKEIFEGQLIKRQGPGVSWATCACVLRGRLHRSAAAGAPLLGHADECPKSIRLRLACISGQPHGRTHTERWHFLLRRFSECRPNVRRVPGPWVLDRCVSKGRVSNSSAVRSQAGCLRA